MPNKISLFAAAASAGVMLGVLQDAYAQRIFAKAIFEQQACEMATDHNRKGYTSAIEKQIICGEIDVYRTVNSASFKQDYGAKDLQKAMESNKVSLSKNNVYNVTLEDVDFMVRVVATEVGPNEPVHGIEAVVDTILNRVEHRAFQGTVRGVLDAGDKGNKEFSAVALASSAFPEGEFDGKFMAAYLPGHYGFDKSYVAAVESIVLQNLFPQGARSDIVNGATFYATNGNNGTERIDFEGVNWGAGPLHRVASIGSHDFYAIR